MELRHTNSNVDIVPTIKVNLVELFIFFKCEKWAQL